VLHVHLRSNSHETDSTSHLVPEVVRLVNLFRYPAIPTLKKLELQLTPHGVDESVFVPIVESRWNVDKQNRRLKSVLLITHSTRSSRSTIYSRGAWERLSAMQKEGLLIRVEDDLGSVRARIGDGASSVVRR